MDILVKLAKNIGTSVLVVATILVGLALLAGLIWLIILGGRAVEQWLRSLELSVFWIAIGCSVYILLVSAVLVGIWKTLEELANE